MAKKNADIKSLIEGLVGEMGEDSQQRLTPEERQLHEVAQRLLKMERDLKAPGAARSTAERVDRILEAIAKEDF